MTDAKKLLGALAYYTRTGDHQMVERTRRLLEKASGETWAEHYRRRWNERPIR